MVGEKCSLAGGPDLVRDGVKVGLTSSHELPHHRIQRILCLESYARPVGEREKAVVDFGVVGKSCEHANHIRIRFSAAESEAGDER